MNHLALHDLTRAQLERFISHPAHAILLAGPTGIGKTAIAEALASQLLAMDRLELGRYPNFLQLQPDGDSISIEVIRRLQKFLQLKTIGDKPIRRVVVIQQAQGLTTEAQNAYLKLLEEPPADTLMILTVSSPRALLPTILSRMQTITVHPPTQAQLQPIFSQSTKNAAALQQAYSLSGGLPGLLHALVTSETTHPLLSAVNTAKEILQKDQFERLAMADSLSKQKDDLRAVLDALERIATVSMAQATTKGDAARIKQWHRIRKLVTETRDAIASSVNAKLAVSNLFLHL